MIPFITLNIYHIYISGSYGIGYGSWHYTALHTPHFCIVNMSAVSLRATLFLVCCVHNTHHHLNLESFSSVHSFDYSASIKLPQEFPITNQSMMLDIQQDLYSILATKVTVWAADGTL